MLKCTHCNSSKTKKDGGPRRTKAWPFFLWLFLAPGASDSLGGSDAVKGVLFLGLFLAGFAVLIQNKDSKKASKWDQCKSCERHFLPALVDEAS